MRPFPKQLCVICAYSWLPGVTRLVVGLTYLAAYQIGSNYWPFQYLNSQEFVSFVSYLLLFEFLVNICFRLQL